jgi:hypothetical protein
MAFNEQLYRAAYTAIDNLITNGLPAPNGVVYTTALDYYNGYGKFQNGQEGFFTGSSGRDTITGSGAEVNGEGGLDVDLYGIDYNINITSPTSVDITPKSTGIGEKDVLIGRTEENLEDGFFLSGLNGTFTTRQNLNNPVTGDSVPLYVGQGNKDFARIQNFTIGKDYVSLSGDPADYQYQYDQNGDLKIYRKTGTGKGDLVGIVEDGPFDVQPRRFLADGTFRLSARVLDRGFNENIYLRLNDLEGSVDASDALAHYVQNATSDDDLIGIFTGAKKGSPVSFSTGTADGNDTLIAYGAQNNQTILSGVSMSVSGGNIVVDSSFGTNEVDTLIGADNTKDNFILGVGTDFNTTARSFYVGGGNADYAIIENYQKRDRVILAGSKDDYSFTPIGNTFEISTTGGDLVGIVEGVTGISQMKSLDNDTLALRLSLV